MPANLTPEYKAAEAAFRQARDPRERLERLREMLRTIPKHKGTDHLQGDIKRRIKELSEEIEGPKKGGAHGGPVLVIRPEGAAQIALIGPPNAGKSSLHARLTGSEARVGPYPFTTEYPEPGMMPHEDIHFQLVDLPAISPDHRAPWLANTLETADACLLVVDVGEAECVERMEALHAVLREKRVTLTARWEQGAESLNTAPEGDEDPFALRLPALILANKADRIADVEAELEAFRELTGLIIPRSRSPQRRARGSARSGRGCFAVSASSASTPRRRAVPPTKAGRSRCAAGRRWRMSRGSSIRTSRTRLNTRASGAPRGSTDSTWGATIR